MMYKLLVIECIQYLVIFKIVSETSQNAAHYSIIESSSLSPSCTFISPIGKERSACIALKIFGL